MMPTQADSTQADAIGDIEAPPAYLDDQANEFEHHTLEKIDKDSCMWHGREAAVEHARRYLTSDLSTTDNGQGTVMGVIFPCTANILGVLLFLRLPWIVGKAGILQGFMLVFVCCSCTFITSLSLSAVATNGKILGGGSYYLISRSLGPAIGAGVGLCFYMANSIGAAMYFMGTVEAWEIAQPNNQIIGAGDINNIRITASCILVAALLFVAVGVKFVSRLGTVFLFIVFGVILCMYIGCLAKEPTGQNFSDNFGPAYSADQKAFPQDKTEHGFISLMALWFPAVTGIMAGSNRSGDLKDPAGSIPKGTLTAQLSTSVVYLSFVVLFGCAAPRSLLLDDPFFAATYAWPIKEVVMYGVMASTIGAGLTSLVSGSRLLSAIASDKTLPILRIFAAQPGKEPRLALLASGVLCACAIAIGQLNAVAPVLTMFFLMCYTCVNLSCATSQAVQDPNWRPGFRFYHWSVSLLGAVLCIWMMFAINWMYAVVALCFCLCIFAYATHNSHEVKWGDGFQGVKFQLAKNILMHIDSTTHIKNWRPQILFVTAAKQDPSADGHVKLDDLDILHFVAQLKGGRGITIVGAICEDTVGQQGPFVSKGSGTVGTIGSRASLDKMLQDHHIKGFSHLVRTANFSEGVLCLTQTAGLGAFQPNCVLAAWPEEWQDPQHGKLRQDRFIQITKTAVELQKVMLVAKGGSQFPDLQMSLNGTIDIWWIVADGGILLLLPFLLQKHAVWQNCSVRLFALAGQSEDHEGVKKQLEAYMQDFRLKVEVRVKAIDTMVMHAVSFVANSTTSKAQSTSDASVDMARQVSAGPFPGLRRQTAAECEAQVLEPTRQHSIFSFQSQRGFPELPPRAFSGQTVLAERDAIATEVASPESVQHAVDAKELELVKGLNQVIRSESQHAELVVTNLPDMTPGGSVSGYFGLVEELTRGLQRCLLARGTTAEVITAFT